MFLVEHVGDPPETQASGVHLEKILLSVTREEDEAVFCVHDTGIGIHPDLLPRIFELFVQGDPGSGCARSGLGIGLAVVRRRRRAMALKRAVRSQSVYRGSSMLPRPIV